MATGIAAAIPIILKPYENVPVNTFEEKNFSNNFFEKYKADEKRKIYTIQKDFLIKNYSSFFEEFVDCIGNDDTQSDNLPTVKTFEEFTAVFDYKIRNAEPPYYEANGGAFSVLGCVCECYWLFYLGSYKAYLEEYSTLFHLERMIERAMKNPLASTVKFGIYSS